MSEFLGGKVVAVVFVHLEDNDPLNNGFYQLEKLQVTNRKNGSWLNHVATLLVDRHSLLATALSINTMCYAQYYVCNTG